MPSEDLESARGPSTGSLASHNSRRSPDSTHRRLANRVEQWTHDVYAESDAESPRSDSSTKPHDEKREDSYDESLRRPWSSFVTTQERSSQLSPASEPFMTIFLARERTWEERYPRKPPADYTEFERKYPPDGFGDEVKDHARVWKVYSDRAKESDQDRLDGWNKTLDILLIFAGLFSAVLTAFVIEVYSTLKPDYQEISARALLLVFLQQNGSSTISAPENPDMFVAGSSARWTNALWFVSLFISLSVALLAILSKQWLEEYSSRMRAPVGSPKQWAMRHAVYIRGLTRWEVGAIIAMLPAMLHLSLFLFFAGLVIFLLDLDPVTGYLIASLAGGLLLLYCLALVAPLWSGDFPTATSTLRQVYRIYLFIRPLFTRFSLRLRFLIAQMRCLREQPSPAHNVLKEHSTHPPFHEARLVIGNEPSLTDYALSWIISILADKEELDVALHAIGALDILESTYELLRTKWIRDITVSRALARQNDKLDDQSFYRLLRTLVFLQLDPHSHLDSNAKEGFMFALSRHRLHNGRYDGKYLIMHFRDTIERKSGLEFISLGSDDAYQLRTLALMLSNATNMTAPELVNLLHKHVDTLETRDIKLLLLQRLEQITSSQQSTLGLIKSATSLNFGELLGMSEAEFLVRSLRVWTLLIRSPDRFGFEDARDPRLLQMLRNIFTAPRYGMELPLPQTLSGSRMERSLEYFASDDFLTTPWQDLTGLETLLRHLGLATSTDPYWSAALGIILRNIYSQLHRAINERWAQSDLLLHASLAGPFRLACTNSMSLLSAHAATEGALVMSPLNLLLRESVGGTSIGSSAWVLAMSSVTPVRQRLRESGTYGVKLAATFAAAICRLQYIGVDVSGQLEEFALGVRRCCFVNGPLSDDHFELARHAKDILPEWWISTVRQLRELEEDAMAVFIARVDEAGSCAACRSPTPPDELGPTSLQERGAVDHTDQFVPWVILESKHPLSAVPLARLARVRTTSAGGNDLEAGRTNRVLREGTGPA